MPGIFSKLKKTTDKFHKNNEIYDTSFQLDFVFYSLDNRI